MTVKPGDLNIVEMSTVPLLDLLLSLFGVTALKLLFYFKRLLVKFVSLSSFPLGVSDWFESRGSTKILNPLTLLLLLLSLSLELVVKLLSDSNSCVESDSPSLERRRARSPKLTKLPNLASSPSLYFLDLSPS